VTRSPETRDLIDVTLMTGKRSRPAALSVGEIADDVMLLVEGVPRDCSSLPRSAYLVVADREVADRAALAGYFLEPPTGRSRTINRRLGKFYGGMLFVGAIWSVAWAVVGLVKLDLVEMLKWLGLAVFVGLLGAYWWFLGDAQGNEEAAEGRRRVRAMSRFFGRK
jgi:hypothetical protein